MPFAGQTMFIYKQQLWYMLPFRWTAINFIMLTYFSSTMGYVTPTVEITSCRHSIATVTLTNVQEGGLVFFRTDNAYNIIPTINGTMIHECVFEDCNILWDEKFYVVVQRRVLIQTKYDVIISFMCNVFSGVIQPIAVEETVDVIEDDFSGRFDSNLTFRYKPEVAMLLYRRGERLESGQEVKLGDEITMIMFVTNDDTGYFDVDAKSCYASGISLIEDHCPADHALFGPFNSTAVGYLNTTFNMFRPTNIAGGPSEVVFTCVLKVCNRNCEELRPKDAEIVYGRYVLARKLPIVIMSPLPEKTSFCAAILSSRTVCLPETSDNSLVSSNRRKRGTEDEMSERGKIPNVVTGYRLLVVTDGEETFVRDETTKNGICISFYIVSSVAGALLLAVGTCLSVYRTFLKYKKTFAQMKNTIHTKIKDGSKDPIERHIECSISNLTNGDSMHRVDLSKKQELQQPTILYPYRRRSLIMEELK